jgi:hypothetical protein
LFRSTCTVGLNCCGNSIYYAVYRNPDLLGCYEPPIPGTQLLGTATYPVACFSTVFPQTVATTRSYVLPNPVAVYVPTATPARQHSWVLSGYPQYTYIGCYNVGSLTIKNATNTTTMTPLLCAAYCNTGNAGAATTFFSLNMAQIYTGIENTA